MNIENIVRGVCTRDGKILLAFFKEENYYFLPGGHVEHGESIFQTLERELKEEASVHAKAHDLALVFEHKWQGKSGLVHEINFVVTFSIEGDAEVVSTEEHLEFVWLPIEELNSVHFQPKAIVDQAMQVASGNTELKFLSTFAK